MDEEIIEQRLSELETQVAEVLKLVSVPERVMNHRGISIVAGEGIRGGGTIDRSRGFAIDFGELEEGIPKIEQSSFPFYNSEEGQHQRCGVEKLTEIVIKSSDFNERFRQLFERMADVENRLRLLSVYERMEQLESEVGRLMEEKNASEERKASENDAGRGAQSQVRKENGNSA